MRDLMNRLSGQARQQLQSIASWLHKSRLSGQILKRTKVAEGWIRKHGLDASLVLALIIVFTQAALLIFNQLRPNHPVLGLKFENSYVHQLSGDGLHAKVKTVLDANDQRPLLIRVGKYQAHITPRQLGAAHDSRLIEQRLLKLGHQGSLWQRLIDQDASLLGLRNLKDSFRTINKQLASVYLLQVNSQVQVAPLNASFVYQDQKLTVQPGSAGLQINIDQAIAALQSVDLSKSNTDLNLPVDHPAPAVSQQELEPLLPQAQKVVARPLTIVGGDKQIRLDSAQLTALLQAEKKPDPSNPSKQVVVISYSDAKLSAVLDQLASQVVVPAQPKVVAGQKVLSAGSSGVHLDGTHAKVAVITELEKRQLQPASQPASAPAPQPAPAAKPQPAPPAQPTPAPKPPQPAPAPAATKPPETPVAPAVGDSIIVPVEKTDAPVINQNASTNPLGRYPATLNGKNMIYLTFDDGPGGYTEQLLDILKRYNVHAVFFLIGKNSAVYPQTVKRIRAEGHTIGNHSYTHSDLSKLSESGVNDELVKTQNTIRDLTSITPDLFRPPYGSLSTSVYNSTAKNSLSIMMWSIDPRDWSMPGASVIVQRIIAGAAPGGNVLLHCNHQQTVEALSSIIEGLRAKGYTLP